MFGLGFFFFEIAMSRLHGHLNSYVFAEFSVPPVVHTQILFKTASVSSRGGPVLEKSSVPLACRTS